VVVASGGGGGGGGGDGSTYLNLSAASSLPSIPVLIVSLLFLLLLFYHYYTITSQVEQMLVELSLYFCHNLKPTDGIAYAYRAMMLREGRSSSGRLTTLLPLPPPQQGGRPSSSSDPLVAKMEALTLRERRRTLSQSGGGESTGGEGERDQSSSSSSFEALASPGRSSLEAVQALVVNLNMLGREEEAERIVNAALTGLQRERQRKSTGLMLLLIHKASYLHSRGKDDEAIPLLLEAKAMMRGVERSYAEMVRVVLADAYEAVGGWKEAQDLDVMVGGGGGGSSSSSNSRREEGISYLADQAHDESFLERRGSWLASCCLKDCIKQ